MGVIGRGFQFRAGATYRSLYIGTGCSSLGAYIMETFLGNLHKDILYNCFKNFLLFIEKTTTT